ncbi:MAG TPA: hypothetical protein PLM07_02640 [Candidatus Rifleibacterium sp.]|nr:hypothetical protein [Candidatus Rifleibacterium sp.]HPT44781.1 hypothetical protein [Candidatus Rifleibacterium sp.]
MYTRNLLTLSCLIGLAIFGPGGTSTAHADLSQRIDATHILAREYELPTGAFAPGSGVAMADGQTSIRNVRRVAVPKKLGQKETFWVNNIAAGKFEQITATLRAIGKYCHVYLEDGRETPQAAIQKVQKQFDAQIYPVNTACFGPENNPGLDGDPKVSLLMLDIQDGYTNPNDGYVAGYFFAGDQMRQADFESYSKVKSNEREILYLDTYPSDPNAADYLEIVAHEFQHMIHNNLDRDEVTWVNEGCSQIAPVFCGFAPPGHYKLLKEDPDRSLNNWAKWNPMPDYGQVYLWNQFIVDHCLPDATSRAAFFKALVSSKKKSIGGYIDAMKTINRSFSDTFTEFTIANRVNDKRLAQGRYAYRQSVLQKFKLPPSKHINTFPVKVSDSVYVWGSDSIFADIANLASRLKISFSGYRRFMGPTYPDFKLAAILQDSTGIQPPKLTFFKLDINPADKNRMIGSIEVNCDGTYDGLTVVVMALAPEDVDDASYMPASGFIYDLNFEVGAAIANAVRGTHNLDMAAFIDSVNGAGDDYTVANIRMREHYANLLIRTVKRDIEKGSLATVDSFIESAGNNARLAPFARDISGMLLFFKNQQNSVFSDEDLQNRIEILSSLK